MDKDLISIIMPAFNAELFIAESIISVINQTYKDWELIIVDDGSKDKTKYIITSFLKDSRIKYLYQENGKQGKARNLGLEISKGAYISFLDADDKWIPNKLSMQIEFMRNNQKIDLLFSQGYNLEDGSISNLDVKIKNIWDKNDLEDFLNQNQIPILSVLMKKEAIMKVGGFSESISIQNVEDYHLWLKLLVKDFKFTSKPDRLFYYRIHPSQSTHQDKELKVPIFFAHRDIYLHSQDANIRRMVVDKLKWFIYSEELHSTCIDLFASHFKKRKAVLLTYLIEKIFYQSQPLSQKIVFKLVSAFA
ncbi:glycosyltransferase family 2 protein [Pedobacter frigidisoli]|uniref:Glycosyltransferase family 2 protein n=1 Tax=Pedobacter frigidisoli TaxID=2530455 RepID=A0A4V2MMQ2_9SPHI|nr:glycosyltransferase family A protein [Pedobacter frigidisoli]TCD07736.1 glycosyltransferase family 2 protein [Pedobacter frigidisoli]